ncbi:MAG: hypothetical protein ACREX4_17970 [Gammaproteobacteria bacterium]
MVANDHNPTILNPDFLERQQIVPEAWGWKVAGPAITTLPFAMVVYDSGVTVTVEPNKLQVTDKSVRGGPESSKVSDIARKYVEVLPHVRYSAVGINFHSLAENTEPDGFLKDRFLKSGSWDNEVHKLQGIGLKFVYPLDGRRLILALDGGIVTASSEGTNKQIPGVLAYANFHRDCSNYPTSQQAIDYLGNADKDWKDYGILLSDIVGINNAS